ncbi:MAG: glycoside hydrolase family 3 N-terminal domain-containing protein [Acidimicrobiales bacterium]
MSRAPRGLMAPASLLAIAALLTITAGCGGPSPQSPAARPPTASTLSRPASTPGTPTTGTSACTALGAIAGWSVQRRAAQLVVAPSLDFNVSSLGATLRQGVGGVLFLGSAPPPAGLAGEVQRAAAAEPPGPPPMVMADEEGGGVQRLAGAVTSFPWPRTVAQTSTVAATRSLGESVGRQMKALAVTVDLAPVLDVDGGNGPNATDADGKRSYSADPATAASYGMAFAEGLKAGGVLPVVKHFPGLGGTTGNTDYGPASTPPLSALRARGLVPFEDAVRARLPAVMVANASVPGLTGGLPASLSPAAIAGLLRGQFGFTGLVLTDSLSAGAISQAGFNVPGAAVKAVEAGADMVLFGSTLTPAGTALLAPAAVAHTVAGIVAAIASAVSSGALSAGRLDDAVSHVLAATGYNPCSSR